MSEEMKEELETSEYTTFSVTTKDGTEIELAVVDEFEFEKKGYVVGALIEGDTINEDGLYIYRIKAGEEFAVEKITNEIEYEKIANAYLDMEKDV